MDILILDDSQERHDVFEKRWPNDHREHVYDIAGAFAAFTRVSQFDLATLDHDLGDYTGLGGAQTGGLFVCRMLVEIPRHLWPKQVIIHSHNPVGAKNMLDDLRAQGIPTIYRPFTP